MADLKTIVLKDIDFSGETSLFEISKKRYDDELSFNKDVPELEKCCILIQEFLYKNRVVPLTATFSIDKNNNRLFTLKDVKNLYHWSGTELIITLNENKPKDVEKLKKVLSKLHDTELMKLFISARAGGASFIKLLDRSEAYLEKYVNVNGKTRLGHRCLLLSKGVIATIVCGSFIATLFIFGPEVAIPLLVLIN